MLRAISAVALVACGASPIGGEASLALVFPGGSCEAASVRRLDVRAYDVREGREIGGHLVASAPCASRIRAWFPADEPEKILAVWGLDYEGREVLIGKLWRGELHDGKPVEMKGLRE